MLSHKVLIGVWNDLMRWYIERCRYWTRLANLIRMKADSKKKRILLDKACGLWGYVWHEHDLVMMFSHMLMKYLENNRLGIHLHINYKLKPRNFSAMRNFYRRLIKAVITLRKELGTGRKWFPEIDLIITEDKPPFLFCIEFKYYHYLPTTWNVIEDLKRKIVTLHTLKKYEVCKDAGIFLLDDGICRRDDHLCNAMKTVLSTEASSLMVLSHHVTYEELLALLNRHISM